jgi:ParB family chromosome partitioning protein
MNGDGSEVAIDDIKVGPRHRRDPGDLHALAASIAAIGLLHPVSIDGDGNLLAGARRLEACKRLGWTSIPVRFAGARP